MGLGQHRHERGRRDELDAMVLPDRLAPESHRQMCLARTRRSKQQDRVAMSDPAAGRQLPDLALIQRRLRVEVEAVEFAYKRERAILPAMEMRRSSRLAISRVTRKAKASRKVICERAASSSSVLS